MIKNLSEYFFPEQEFYLDEIAFARIENLEIKKEHTLICEDNINVDVNENTGVVKVIVSRRLAFEPEEMFSLLISFGADLKLNMKKKDDYKWSEIDLAEEFRNYGEFVTDNLMSRISLLISQITSSFGQQPLVLEPKVSKKYNNEI